KLLTMEPEDENLIKQAYREYLSRELSQADIQVYKENLLHAFYSPAVPAFSFLNAVFLVPAAAVLGLFLLFFHFEAGVHPVKGPAVPLYRTFGHVMEEAQAL